MQRVNSAFKLQYKAPIVLRDARSVLQKLNVHLVIKVSF